MGLTSVPRSLDIKNLHEWSETKAPGDIVNIRTYMEKRKCTMDLLEKERQRKIFLDPKKRGHWFESAFGTRIVTCPNFVVDSRSGKKTFDEKEVKRIYVEEGASLLKNKIDLPPQFDAKQEEPTVPPPDPCRRSNASEGNPSSYMVWPNGSHFLGGDSWRYYLKRNG